MSQPAQPPPPSNGKFLGWLKAVQGLTLANVLVIGLLAIIAVPLYVIWKALGNEQLLDRLMSQYEETPDQSGCLLRHVRERGGPDQYGISSGFAVVGIDRYFVTVIRSHAPASEEEVQSYCETVKRLADRLVDRRDDAGNITGP